MKGLADKGEREEKRRNEGQKGLGDMNPLTHITITRRTERTGAERWRNRKWKRLCHNGETRNCALLTT